MASIECPFCDKDEGCHHLIGEGDHPIEWSWHVIDTLRHLCEQADLMKIDIGKLAKGVRGFEDLTLQTQEWYGDYVPSVIVDSPGFEMVANSWDSGGPMSGTYYGVFIDPKQARKILGGQGKTGHLSTRQNRPFPVSGIEAE